MHKLCDYIDDELLVLEDKVGKGGKLSTGEIEYGKNLAKFKMALLTNKAMERDGASNDYYGPKRDHMGRYTREAREDFIHELRELMRKAPDEHTKKKIEKLPTCYPSKDSSFQVRS